MYNLIVLAARPSDWSHEQFIDWWRGEHAEVTYPLPGLRRWLHTELSEGSDERSAGWDGLSILSFDSREDLDAALASEEWRGGRRARRGHARATDDLHRRRADDGGRVAPGRLTAV